GGTRCSPPGRHCQDDAARRCLADECRVFVCDDVPERAVPLQAQGAGYLVCTCLHHHYHGHAGVSPRVRGRDLAEGPSGQLAGVPGALRGAAGRLRGVRGGVQRGCAPPAANRGGGAPAEPPGRGAREEGSALPEPAAGPRERAGPAAGCCRAEAPL
ncbi:unnamed protein product, partial [Prorocentrum cordatum]